MSDIVGFSQIVTEDTDFGFIQFWIMLCDDKNILNIGYYDGNYFSEYYKFKHVITFFQVTDNKKP